MSLWSVEALFIIPTGAVCLALLLTDIRQFQKFALAVCSIRIAFGKVQVSVSSIFALFTLMVFCVQSYTTFSNPRFVPSPNQTVEMVDRMRMKEWRNDRNWWISLFACTLWLICWRVQTWVLRYCCDTTPKSTTLKKKD